MQDLDIKATIRQALACYEKGDFSGAEKIYRSIVVNSKDPLHYADLGVVLEAQGKHEEAEAAYKAAIEFAPGEARPYYNLGNLLRNFGRVAEAIACFKKTVSLDPENADANNNLGLLLVASDQLDECISHFRKAIAAKPDFFYAHNNLGTALYRANRFEEALRCFQHAISLREAYPEAHDNLGSSYLQLGSIDQAIECHRRAIELRPDSANTHNNLGNAYLKSERYQEAIQCYSRAIELEPRSATGYISRASAYIRSGQYAAAVQDGRKAVEINPSAALAHGNLAAAHLAISYSDSRRLDKAIEHYGRAIELMPDNAELHWEHAVALLLRGDFARGWKEYEWRWLGGPNLKGRKPEFHQPVWTGEDITGKTILLVGEQGRGDIIQFVRYAPLVAARNAKVILICHPELVRLMRSVEGISEVVSIRDPLPQFDVYCLLLSLPHVFRATLETLPRDVPYLSVDQAQIKSWQSRIGAGNELKVGLIWRGWSGNSVDHKRSINLVDLAPLFRIKGVRYYSLQKERPDGESQSLSQETALIDWTEDIHDFADTAALMMNLDLIVSVDTAGLHLAGALGKRAWLLNRHESEWRWMLDREGSPWYPTVRIFRQPSRSDWKTVMGQVAGALEKLVLERS